MNSVSQVETASMDNGREVLDALTVTDAWVIHKSLMRMMWVFHKSVSEPQELHILVMLPIIVVFLKWEHHLWSNLLGWWTCSASGVRKCPKKYEIEMLGISNVVWMSIFCPHWLQPPLCCHMWQVSSLDFATKLWTPWWQKPCLHHQHLL